MRYVVGIPEVHIATVTVELPEGATPDEIRDAASETSEMDGAELLEYSHTLDRDEWTIMDSNHNYIE